MGTSYLAGNLPELRGTISPKFWPKIRFLGRCVQRAMAAEAEAAREARAKVVAAEGEQKASLHLKEAALVLEESNSALQLRYLQVRCKIGD